jgi:hypothetical protein
MRKGNESAVETGLTVYGKAGRGRYVPAVAPGTGYQRRVELPAPPQSLVIPHGGQSEQAIREETSPIQRAVATVISSAFFGLLIVPLGLLLIWLTDADPGAIALSIVGVVLAVGYLFLRFDRQAHDHSPAGVALHDRELTHEERMYELERRYDVYERMMAHLMDRAPGHGGQRDQAE